MKFLENKKTKIYTVIINNGYCHSLLLRFSSQSKQDSKRKIVKKIELSRQEPTPWPPINPKMWDYEAQKGSNHFKQQETEQVTINVAGLFLFAGFICGGIITLFQPKDFRNEFKFYSALPDAKFSKLGRERPENIQDTFNINREIRQDQASALSYSIFTGLTGGITGYLWFRFWTHPLRIKNGNKNWMELRNTLTELRANWVRNILKGTIFGSLGVLGMIWISTFISYIFLGKFFDNKYVDKSFWEYMTITYAKNIESRKQYEVNLEMQERMKEKLELPIPTMPAFKKATKNEQGYDDNLTKTEFEELKLKKEREKQKRVTQREMFENTIVGMEWNTSIYQNTADIGYYGLTKQQKAIRWNMAREMAMLATSCSLYIVLPIFCLTNITAIRIYQKYWQQLLKEITKTKQMPHKTY